MVPSTTRERRFGLPDTEVLVLCGAAALGALLVILHAPAVARIPAGLILFALLPGAVLARLARRDPRVRLEDWLLQTITFSPPIVIAARALSTTVGLSWEAFAVALAAVLAGAALVVPAARVRGLEADRRVLAIGLAIGIAVALPAWVDLRTRVFGDALVHAQIVHELQLRGLPPQDPSYAGVPLTYMWLLHVGWAALGAATGLAPFYVFPLVNGLMAVALVMAARLGTEALGGGRSAQRAAAVVVPLGMNALGWLPAVAFTLGRAMIGHDRGAGVLAAGLRALLVAPDANGIASALLPGGYVVLASFLYKYLCANALATGLTYAAAAWGWAATQLRAPRLDRSLALAVSVLGATAVHPMVGLPAAVGLLFGLAAALVDRRAQPRAVATTVAVGLGIALALPIVRLLLGGAEHSAAPISFRLVTENFRILPQVLVGVLPAAIVWWRRSSAELAHRAFVLGYAAAVTVFALAVRLPFLAYAYPVYVVYLACALPAGEGFARCATALRERGWPRRARAALLLVLLLPSTLLLYHGFLRQGHPGGLAGYPEGTDEMRVYEYLRMHTPVDAVVVDLPYFASSAAAGYSGRRGFFGGLRQSDLVGYPREAMRRRDAAVRDLYFGQGALREGTRAELRRIAADVYVVAHRSAPPNPAVAVPAGIAGDAVARLDALAGEFVPVVRTAGITLYRWVRA